MKGIASYLRQAHAAFQLGWTSTQDTGGLDTTVRSHSKMEHKQILVGLQFTGSFDALVVVSFLHSSLNWKLSRPWV